MRRWSQCLFAITTFLAFWLPARASRADFVKVYARAQLGDLGDFNLSHKDQDVFSRNSGFVYGAEAGVHLLALDFYMDYDRLSHDAGWFDAMLGTSFELGPLHLGVAAGYGTAQLSGIEQTFVANQGFLVQGRLGVSDCFLPLGLICIGAEFDPGYHYLVGGHLMPTVSGTGSVGVGPSISASGTDYQVLGTLTVKLGI